MAFPFFSEAWVVHIALAMKHKLRVSGEMFANSVHAQPLSLSSFHGSHIMQLRLSQFSSSVVSDSLWSHGLQHARLPWASSSPGACSNSCPVSWWCHPTISSSHTIFLLPSTFPNIFSNESDVYIRRPKYWSFSFSLRPSKLFRVDFL